MIVGCYSLDLYCDHPDGGQYRCTNWPGQWTGTTDRNCYAQARRAGWKLDLRQRQVLCPAHAKEGFDGLQRPTEHAPEA